MRNVLSRSNNVFVASMMIVISIIAYMALTGGPNNRLSPAFIILGTCVYVFLALKLKKLTDKVSIKKDIPAYIIAGLYFIALTAASLVITVMPYYTLNNVQYAALKFLEKGKYTHSDYLTMYRHEIPTVFAHYFMYAVGRLFGLSNYLKVGAVFTSFSISLTSLGLYFIVKHFKDSSAALWVMISFVLNPIFYIYASYSDNDILSMPWVLWGNLLLLKAFKDSGKSKKVIALIAAGSVVTCVGIVLLPINIVPTIAIVIFILSKKPGAKKRLMLMIPVIYLVLIMIFTDIALACGFKTDRDDCFPPEHYIVIGINQHARGWYPNYPIKLTKSFPTYKEKVAGDREKIKDSFRVMGASDFLNNTASKWKQIWAFGFGKEYDLASTTASGTAYDYTIGTKSIIFDYFSHIMRTGTIIFMLIAVAGDFIKKEKQPDPFLITLGIAVFIYIFWESESITSLKYIPWMLMLMPKAEDHLKTATAFVKKNAPAGSSKYINVALRSVAVGITVITAIVFMTTRNNAVRNVKEITDVVVYQNNRFVPKMSQLENNRYVQTFNAKKSFNVISFKASMDVETDKILSLAVRRDSDKKVVRREYFGQHNFNNYDFVEFYFEEPLKAGEYSLIIKPIDYNRIIKKEPLIMSKLDYSPDRTLRANNRILNDDLYMQISSRRYRTDFSKTVYYGVTALILLTETACVVSVFRKTKEEY